MFNLIDRFKYVNCNCLLQLYIKVAVKLKKEKTKVVRIPVDIAEKLNYFVKAQDKTRNQVLRDFIDPLFQVGVNYFKDAKINVEETLTVLNHSVTFEFSGKSNLVCGSMSEAELEQLRKQHFEEVKLSIAEENQKQIRLTENKEK